MKFSIFAQIRFSAASISSAFLNEDDRLKNIAFNGRYFPAQTLRSQYNCSLYCDPSKNNILPSRLVSSERNGQVIFQLKYSKTIFFKDIFSNISGLSSRQLYRQAVGNMS